METQPTSQFRTYVFHRNEGFYPVNITKASVEANIAHNPGTLKVTDALDNKVIWTLADGWLDKEHAQLFGGQP